MKGVKSIDVKITAIGDGIVNSNGSFELYSEAAGKKVKNHTAPKLRNVNPLALTNITDLNGRHEVFVSSNCVRNALFAQEFQHLNTVNSKNLLSVLTSFGGLVRGYLATEEGSASAKRTSALLLSDFVTTTELRYEQFSNARADDANKLWSQHRPCGRSEYNATASISVENLAFVPLTDKFSRTAYKGVVTQQEIDEVCDLLCKTLKNIGHELNLLSDDVKSLIGLTHPIDVSAINVEGSNNYLRYNRFGAPLSSDGEGEAGVMLNDEAVDVVVWEILHRLAVLNISKTKGGYLRVTGLEVDYNDGLPMRIDNAQRSSLVERKRQSPYWKYYISIPLSPDRGAKQHKDYEEKEKERKNKNNKSGGKEKEKNTPTPVSDPV